jgi:polysaccharide chain length determinant protein (PEP-CTERM system associated)
MQAQENIQQIINQLVSILRGIWRFRWYAMTLAWIIAITGWVYVFQIPNEYKAEAKVVVDTDSLLRPLMRGLALETNVGQRVQLMTQKLLSRPVLEKLARKTDLDIKASSPEEMNALIRQLKSSIKFQGTKRQDLYTISATHANPETAKVIVQALLTIFIEDTLGNTRQDTDVAEKFLMQQINEYESRLIEAENRIKKFKQENVGNMPAQGGGYFDQLHTVQSQLEQAQLQLREAQNMRDELKRQLAGEEPVFGFGTTTSQQQQQYSHPLDEQIRQLRKQIDDLLLVYTEQHPNVIARKEKLAELEREREKDLKNMPKSVAHTTQQIETNPVYQQLKISLGQAEAQVSSLAVRVQEYENRVNELRQKINTVPEIEAKLKSLNRDYELNKKNYDSLVARLESVKLSEEVEQTGDDVKFETIDPPRVPENPVGPNRFFFNSIALIGGLAVGLGLAFLLSQIRPAIYDRHTLKLVSGFPVFGVVSRFWTPELLFKKRVEFTVFISVGFVLVLAYGGVLLLEYSDTFAFGGLTGFEL